MVNSYDSDSWKPTSNKAAEDSFIEYYAKIFSPYKIDTMHDCTFGSGSLTYPLYKMGYSMSGSDLSENMITLARNYIQQEGLEIEVFQKDFREINLDNKVDCLISTGNSLPHVSNTDLQKAIRNFADQIRSHGYFYFDIRNWDKILTNKQRFFSYALSFKGDIIRHLMQVWDFSDDMKTVKFNLVFTDYDKDGKIINRKIETIPTYYPIRWNLLEKYLEEAGFEIIKRYNHDIFHNFGSKTEAIFEIGSESTFMDVDWYAVLSRKIH